MYEHKTRKNLNLRFRNEFKIKHAQRLVDMNMLRENIYNAVETMKHHLICTTFSEVYTFLVPPLDPLEGNTQITK